MNKKLPYKFFLFSIVILWNIQLFGQSIGYNFVNYVPQSEEYTHTKMPVTPALENFTQRLSENLRSSFKGLKKKDDNYDLVRQEILKRASLNIEATLRAIVEIESLKVLNEEEALMTLYEFMDCWEKKSFRTSKKNFCKGCWEKHIEGERYYKERFAVIY